MKHQSKAASTTYRLSMIAFACQLACMSSTAFAQDQKKQTTESNEPISANQITITGKKVGMGLMVEENAPKARSTITAEELAKQRPTGNAYEALELMPAVNSYNHDASGLFGGGLTLRGFNSDQIGATINGVPVNDSGNFAVYPQEFVDQENTCTQFVTQGSTDVDSPQIGATGGNFGITTCDPAKEKRTRVMQTIGGLHLRKTFVRFDTGLWSDGRSRFFISASDANVEKWKGQGRAMRDHVDLGYRIDFDRFNSINATLLYNRAINNNFATFNLADLNKYGYYYDYAAKFQGHVTPTKGKADNDPSVAFADSYYNLSKNPFENAIASVVGKFRLNENTDVRIVPYYWFGYGTGGNQQRLQSESQFLNTTTGKNTAGVDLNGDGDTLDRVIVANSSVTRTNRPGITASIAHQWNNHTLLGGFWAERAIHEQFGPMVPVDANGIAADIWLESDRIRRPDGSLFQSRDWRTISTAYQFFAQDTMGFMDDKVLINVGVRVPTMKRDFTNFANESAGTTYKIAREYTEVLPQFGARYQVDNNNQFFASLAKNMKAPPNFVYSALPIVNGAPVLGNDVQAETSYNLDVGYRLQSDKLTSQITLYTVDFRDRQATAYNPITDTRSLMNVGKVKTQGFEIEAGNKPINGWSFYGSVGYAKSEFRDNMQFLVTSPTRQVITLPIIGNQLPNTPKWKYGLSVSYEQANWYTRLKAKYTSDQQATMMNDELVPAYTLLGLDAGYQFPKSDLYKKLTLRLSISNLLNEKYRNASSNSVTNAKAVGSFAASSVFYYMGAPRLTSVTLSADF
ncbi:TonB-dependent receptor [Undibacterium cyanobacteriorum]|uniref:TonB-dependent receptor n=1 Tax=Undibacterium cyanobacteriorum TaxID=3073561 RepID=A0ABY9RIM0_9BURK|nr:TonB-dependent receptor [Undibacterium sp. 20NA77.5]WMW81050.1 TonB-dependent receptor [Undibacterium sp. 20NA77.5]